MNSFNFDRQEERVRSSAKAYRSADPFPHISFDDFLEEAPLKDALRDFPAPDQKDWAHYVHANEKKLAQTKRELIPPSVLKVIDDLNSPRFVTLLEELTGIQGLVPDEDLEGGGLHQSKRNGFLNIHADFTAHPYKKNWRRRVNLLVYLNEDWKEEYGGHLQLWDRQAKACVRKILPVFNRSVIFSTDPDSFHGLPEPLLCPADRTRKSIALYYFTVEKEKFVIRSTEYRAKPTDGAVKKGVIFADKMLLRFFDFLKRKFGISNKWANSLLKLFSK